MKIVQKTFLAETGIHKINSQSYDCFIYNYSTSIVVGQIVLTKLKKMSLLKSIRLLILSMWRCNSGS
jgi:hypothetical protein